MLVLVLVVVLVKSVVNVFTVRMIPRTKKYTTATSICSSLVHRNIGLDASPLLGWRVVHVHDKFCIVEKNQEM